MRKNSIRELIFGTFWKKLVWCANGLNGLRARLLKRKGFVVTWLSCKGARARSALPSFKFIWRKIFLRCFYLTSCRIENEVDYRPIFCNLMRILCDLKTLLGEILRDFLFDFLSFHANEKSFAFWLNLEKVCRIRIVLCATFNRVVTRNLSFWWKNWSTE